MFNSVISMPNAKFMTADIKIFYLNTEMIRYEYMQLPIELLPQESIDQYQLMNKVHNGYIYVEICKGMYGLPQASIIANKKLTKHLAKHGYKPMTHTPGLWKHNQQPVHFSLIIDDFGIKYVGQEHDKHLLSTIALLYSSTSNWTGALYCD
jgi:hypothetical protein